jgi:tetratricopeptide (TPR) repeat protein
LKLLGMGGMGVVYQALDRDLGVQVALKVLRPPPGNPTASAEMQQRFKSELLLARKITHRNVIRIHDIGKINGIRFISMPFVEGDDLATVLAKGPLPFARTLRYARQLASGLMAVHAAGVIHRDIKPANIMIGEHDQALLMDFGIARSSAPGALQRTAPGAAVGTAAYMAPEQARGEPTDPRTDIYAFGLILYEMILGAREISIADLLGRLKAAPTSPRQINPQVPEALDAIVTRCLQPNPANRFQNAIELASAISALSRGGRTRAPIAAMVGRWLPRAAAVALVAALAGLAYWTATHGVVSALTRSILPESAAAQVAVDVGRISRSGPGDEDSAGRVPRSGPDGGTDIAGQVPRSGPDGSARSGPGAGTDVVGRVPRSGPGGSASPALGKNAATDALDRGDLRGAAREAERAIKAHPQSPAAYLPLAATAALTAPATARVTYERMAATGPAGASLAATGLADLALYQGRYGVAAEILEAAIARDARTPDRAGLATKYIALAEARTGQGRQADAVAAVRRALGTSRDEDVLLPAARLFIVLHREDAARSIAKELAASQEGNGRAYGRIVDAEIALGRGDTASAIETLLLALKSSDLWLVRFVLGSAYLRAEQYPEAIAQLNMCEVRRGEATTLFLDDVPSIRYLGMLEYLLARAREGAGLTREAAEGFRQFLLLRGGSPEESAERDARIRLTRLAD